MAQYIDLEYLRAIGNLEPASLDEFDAAYPGRVVQIIEAVSRIFDSRLAKRYATPFVEPFPESVKWHVAQVVSHQIWLQRGFNAGSSQDNLIVQARDEAFEWLKEAADAKDGLVELPAREPVPGDGDKSGVVKTAPIGRSFASPYSWMDQQRERIRGGSR